MEGRGLPILSSNYLFHQGGWLPDGRNILRCFVAKVSYVVISRILIAFFGTFWNFIFLFVFFCTIWVFFWAFYAVLLQIRFVVIYALFWVKLFWLKPCSCKKVVFLHLCKEVAETQGSETSCGETLRVLLCFLVQLLLAHPVPK